MDNAISDRLRQHRQNHPRAEVCEFLRGLLEDGYSVVSTASLAAPRREDVDALVKAAELVASEFAQTHPLIQRLSASLTPFADPTP